MTSAGSECGISQRKMFKCSEETLATSFFSSSFCDTFILTFKKERLTREIRK